MHTGEFIGRDESWLSFNNRVLNETGFKDLKVYDKIKFLAIHSSNLEEFARVRLSFLENAAAQNEGGEYADELACARLKVHEQTLRSRSVLDRVILPELSANGIHLYQDTEEVMPEHQAQIMQIFMTKVLSYLQPVIIKPETDFFLEDRMLYFLIDADAGKWLNDLTVILNIPRSSLPRFYQLDAIDQKEYFIYLDDIIRIGISSLFNQYQIRGFYSIKVNRDAGLYLDEDTEVEDFVEVMQSRLDVRKTGAPSRFQYDSAMPDRLVQFCREYFELESGEMLPVSRYLSTSDFFTLPNPKGNSLLQATWKPLAHPILLLHGNYFEAIAQQDFLLHFPYQSYDYVLVLFNLAVLDPDVTEIIATFYRVASDSHIVNALISAAKNGKKVKAFVEIKARFDEANNIYWAEKMSEAGVEITYSIPGIKVHAKAALIKRREQGVERRYGFFGTGNFNEKTAGIYSDMGLFTSNETMCMELEAVFNYLYDRKQPAPFNHLLVSQFGSFEQFIALIDYEINQAKQGLPCGITVKVNNLEEKNIIEKLYEAAGAGVSVTLLIRSICCVNPGFPPAKGNIRLIRIVGRYLEHSRVFIFHNSGETKVYMGSADWMKRNLHDRVEVVFPVLDKTLKKQVLDFIAIQNTPATKSELLGSGLHPLDWEPAPESDDAQEAFYNYLKQL